MELAQAEKLWMSHEGYGNIISCLITLKSDSTGDKVTQCLSGAAGCFPAGSPQHSDSD